VVAAQYNKDDLLNCWTSSSEISGYHADFHEGHGTVGAGQGCGIDMACYVWIGLKGPTVYRQKADGHMPKEDWVIGGRRKWQNLA